MDGVGCREERDAVEAERGLASGEKLEELVLRPSRRERRDLTGPALREAQRRHALRVLHDVVLDLVLPKPQAVARVLVRDLEHRRSHVVEPLVAALAFLAKLRGLDEEEVQLGQRRRLLHVHELVPDQIPGDALGRVADQDLEALLERADPLGSDLHLNAPSSRARYAPGSPCGPCGPRLPISTHTPSVASTS